MLMYRLVKATLGVINNGSPDVKTPDIQGTGTTTAFTEAVIAEL